MSFGSHCVVFNVINEKVIAAVPTLYFRSSSNLSSNLWIFFFSTWILFVSWADVNSSFSSSQEPRDELRLRLQRCVMLLTSLTAPSYSTNKTLSSLPDKWVCVRWRGRHFSVVQVLLALSVGVETRGQHWVAVFLQQLADQSSPGVGGQSGFLTVHALPLHWRVRWDWFWVTHKQTRFMLKCDTLSKMQTDDI